MRALLRALVAYPLTKLVSLVLAVFLWFYVNAELSEERTFDVPVAIQAPEGFMLVGEVPRTVSVKVVGPRGIIRRLAAGDLRTTYRPESVRVGRAVYTLSEEVFPLPQGVTLGDVPPRVELTFAPVYIRTLDVRVTYEGEPAPQHEVEGVSVHPSRVTVRGPQEVLDALKTVPTAPVDIAGQTALVTQEVRIRDVFDHEGRSVRVYCGQTVRATVRIREKLIRKKIEDVPVRVLAPAGAAVTARVRPASVSLWLQGKPEDVAALTPQPLVVYVEPTGLRPGVRQTRPVQVVPPPGVSVVSVEPAEVEVVLGP